MKSILAADDDLELLSTVEYTLKKNKHSVIAVSDCSLAIDTALIEKPDLILLTINFGDCDDRDICRLLEVERRISIHSLSFSANGFYAENTGDFKANGFIQNHSAQRNL